MSGGQTPTRGVVYIATGALYADAARRSAASLRRSNPGLPVALFTDQADPGPEFDIVENVPDPHARSKIDCLGRTPFERTLFSTPTPGSSAISPASSGCSNASTSPRPSARASPGASPAAAVAPRRAAAVPGIQHRRAALPPHAAVLGFFRDWKAAYVEHGRGGDQITFRELLWASDLRLATLPREYNTRRYHLIDRLTWSGPSPVVLHLNRFHPRKGWRFLRGGG
jgi:hypothetical protein